MTSINFISTTRIATSTIQTNEMKMYDILTTSNVSLTMSNNFLLVNQEPLQSGGNFASTLSTYQTYTSTLFIGDQVNFSFTALYPLDVQGVTRTTELSTHFITTSTLFATNQLSTFETIASTIQTNELRFIDMAMNSSFQVALSNETFLINGKQLQSAGFPSSLSTYQIFASTIQLSEPNLFNFTAEFNLDITGTAHITNYLSVGSVYTGAQYIGLQFG